MMGKVKVALEMLALAAFVLLYSVAGMVYISSYSLSETLKILFVVSIPIIVITLLLVIYLNKRARSNNDQG